MEIYTENIEKDVPNNPTKSVFNVQLKTESCRSFKNLCRLLQCHWKLVVLKRIESTIFSNSSESVPIQECF